MATKLINRYFDDSDFTADETRCVSLCLQLAANLMSEGNLVIQKKFLELSGYTSNVSKAVGTDLPPNLFYSIASVVKQNMANSLELEVPHSTFVLLGRVFQYCSTLCTRHNTVGQ